MRRALHRCHVGTGTGEPVPVLVCPGNHDARGAFRTVLLGEPAAPGPVNRVGRAGGAVFALCDSTIPGRSDGLLADETLSWLDTVLTGAGDDPAFVCCHHPPVRVGLPVLDEIRQFGEDRLAEVIARHPNVVAILCGHAHTATAGRLAGVPVLAAPGTASTVRLPLEGGLVDFASPPGLALDVLHEDRQLVTHYRVVP